MEATCKSVPSKNIYIYIYTKVNPKKVNMLLKTYTVPLSQKKKKNLYCTIIDDYVGIR